MRLRTEMGRMRQANGTTQREDFVETSDGGLVAREVTDARFVYLADDDDEVLLTVTVDAAMSAGAPMCTRMTLDGGRQPLDKTLLGQLDPRWFALRALSPFGWSQKPGQPGVYNPDPESAYDALAGAPKRRSVDTSRLAEVAEAFERGKAPGVVADCHVSKSQAYRLIAEARKAGLLP